LKNKKSKNWLIKQKKDLFFRQSKILGYRSRSAFKLIEMDKKFKFLNQNSFLLDLGSSPGGWSQVASKVVLKGKILAIDIIPMKKVKNVDFINGNFSDNEIRTKIKAYFNNKATVVLSDMAANTTGNRDLDSFRTGELSLNAMDLAKDILSRDGIFLTKVFMGSTFQDINDRAKNIFKNVIKYKPLSSKRESREIYIFCKGILNV